MLRDLALHEHHRAVRVQPGGEQLSGGHPGPLAQLGGLLRHGDGVQVDHAVERVVSLLQRHPLAQRAKVIADVERVGGGLDAGQTRGLDIGSQGRRRRCAVRFPSPPFNPCGRLSRIRLTDDLLAMVTLPSVHGLAGPACVPAALLDQKPRYGPKSSQWPANQSVPDRQRDSQPRRQLVGVSALHDGHDFRRAEHHRVRGLVGGCLLGGPLGRNPGTVVLQFPGDLARFPLHRPGHQRRRVIGRGQAAVPGLDRGVRAPGQHIVQVPCALVRGGVDDLGPQVVIGPGQRLAKPRLSRDQVQDLGDHRAVPAQQMLDPGHVQAGRAGQRVPGVPQRRCSRPRRPAARSSVQDGGDPPSSPCATASTASRAIMR